MPPLPIFIIAFCFGKTKYEKRKYEEKPTNK